MSSAYLTIYPAFRISMSHLPPCLDLSKIRGSILSRHDIGQQQLVSLGWLEAFGSGSLFVFLHICHIRMGLESRSLAPTANPPLWKLIQHPGSAGTTRRKQWRCHPTFCKQICYKLSVQACAEPLAVKAIRSHCTWPSRSLNYKVRQLGLSTSLNLNIASLSAKSSSSGKLIIAKHLDCRWLIRQFCRDLIDIINLEWLLHEIESVVCQLTRLWAWPVQWFQVIDGRKNIAGTRNSSFDLCSKTAIELSWTAEKDWQSIWCYIWGTVDSWVVQRVR